MKTLTIPYRGGGGQPQLATKTSIVKYLMRLRRHSVSKHSPFINTIPSNDDCHIPCHFERSEKSNNTIKNEPFPKKYGFTLAEVLITLGIIGIVAALTMPSLIQKQQEKETVTRLKKVYSTLSQAFLMMQNENGKPSDWYSTEGNGTPDANKIMSEKFTSFLKLSKNCETDKGCFPDVVYKGLSGKDNLNWNNSTWVEKILTTDGMSMIFYSYGNHGVPVDGVKSFGSIMVDINGFKGPNVNGIDTFTFILTDKGVYPGGIKTEGTFPEACNIKDCKDFCESCAGWVIYNENMDYLHCDDLSWDGKLKCK